jgi:O-antigen ligase
MTITGAFEIGRLALFDVMVSVYLFFMLFLNHTPLVYIPNVLFVMLSIYFLTRLISGKESLGVTSTVLYFALILVGSILPVLTGMAASMPLAQSHVVRSFQLLVLIVIISSYAKDLFRLLVVLTSITSGYLAAYVVGVLIMQINNQGRFAGLFSNPNMAGFWSINVIIVCGLLLHLRTHFKHPRRWSIYVGLVITAAASLIILSQSRKSLLALGLVLLFYLMKRLFLSRHRLVFLSAMFISFSFASIYMSVVPDNPVMARFQVVMPQTTGVASEDASVVDRLEFYKAGLRMIYNNPIIGYGGDAFPAIGERFSTTFRHGRDLHSAILNTYIESGVIGFTSYLLMYASLLLFIVRHLGKHPVFPFLLLSMGLLVLVQLGESLYLDKFMWLLLIVLCFVKDHSSLIADRPPVDADVAALPPPMPA